MQRNIISVSFRRSVNWFILQTRKKMWYINWNEELKKNYICKYLGTNLYFYVKHKHTQYVVGYLIVILNNLLADFSCVDSLSRLFDSFVWNLYESQLFTYNYIQIWNYCMLLEGNQLGKYGQFGNHVNLIAIYYITLTAVIPLITLWRNAVFRFRYYSLFMTEHIYLLQT